MTGSHRATVVRPRYGRLAILGSSVAVTLIAVLGSMGALPTSAGEGGQAPRDTAAIGGAHHQPQSPAPTTETPTTEASTSPSTSTEPSSDGPSTSETTQSTHSTAADAAADALPADSGSGKRIVFSEDRQRVWLVDSDGAVRRTYLVSGSVLDNLEPGRYHVYSRSRWAVGVEDSGVMQYFARFTKGPGGAAIGFHTIPTKHGTPLQTVAQLGTPQSHGCIRQQEADAIALWDFAPIGTAVVVTA